jgi:pyridoxamine 5'-phosphate oxidase family protein
MSAFTEREIEYLGGQHLGRLATSGRDGQPHVVPVGFRLDPEANAIEIGGGAFGKSKKWRDLQANPRVAFVVDDLESVEPWTPRGLEVRGRAKLHEEGGDRFGDGWDPAWISILPERITSWGIEGPAFSDGAGRRRTRSVEVPGTT